MYLDSIRLLFDFGMVVLVWMIQLVVYPSFSYYSREDLVRWHLKYTRLVSFIVMPLMLGQALTLGFQLFLHPNWYSLGSMLILIVPWCFTFLQFVPMHEQIGLQNFDTSLLERLVRQNWWRTVSWTVLFLFSAIYLTYSI